MIRCYIVSLVCFTCSIGLTKTYDFEDHGRIIGGDIVDIKEVPYQLSIEFKNKARFNHGCGASIIGRSWALTAAHCTYGKAVKDVRIRSGSNTKEKGGKIHYVEQITIHPKYDNPSLDYDVSVIKVSKPFNYSSSTYPIKLTHATPPVETRGMVSGWGAYRTSGKLSNELRQATVFVLDRVNCSGVYKGRLTSRMLCAGSYAGDSGPCLGDDGGPLVSNGALIGIVSLPAKCGAQDQPTVYANVAEHLNWAIGTAQEQYTSDSSYYDGYEGRISL